MAKLDDSESPSDEILERLNADLRTAAAALTQSEVRNTVDLFYQVQNFRIAAANIVRSQPGEPNSISDWIFKNFQKIEKDIASAMGAFAAHYKVGQWLQSIYGIGPIISAGLLAHLEIKKAKTPGNFLSFAGMIEPKRQPWEKKQKRPWNAKLKTLVTEKMGETFVKFSGKDECVYGKLYAKRKLRLIKQNAVGCFSDHALKRSKEVDDSTFAYQWYSGQYLGKDMGEDFFLLDLKQRGEKMKKCRLEAGKGTPMLPPAHLHQRATRVVAQMLLCHLHYVMYEDYWGKTYEFKPYVHSSNYNNTSPGFDDKEHEWIMMPPGWPNDALSGVSIKQLKDKPKKVDKKKSE